MREYMMWFFAFGLIGLRMQAAWQTIREAGGKAAFYQRGCRRNKGNLVFLCSMDLFIKGTHLTGGLKWLREKATKEEQKQMEDRALGVFASEKRRDMTALIVSFVLAVMVLIAFK